MNSITTACGKTFTMATLCSMMALLAFMLFAQPALAGGGSPAPEPTPTPTPETPPKGPGPDPGVGPSWKKLPLACLPQRAKPWIDGKAENKQEPCHCPPLTLCPTSGDYTRGLEQPAKRKSLWAMPDYMVFPCCPKPTCNIDVTTTSGSGCNTSVSYSGLLSADICLEFKPKLLLGSTPAIIAENKHREKVTEDLNDCVAACKVPNIGFLKNANFNNSPTPEYNAVMDKLECEQSCRFTAASRLSLAKPKADVLSSGSYRYPDFTSTPYVKGDSGVTIESNGLMTRMYCEAKVSGDVCATTITHSGSCSSSSDCLAAGTLVTMEDGSTKAIETLKVGDKVKSVGDGGIPSIATVTELNKRVDKLQTLYNINRGLLRITPDHPVRTADGWKALDYNKEHTANRARYGLDVVPELKEGDIILTGKGTLSVRDITLERTEKNVTVYNLTLEGGDSFYANDVVVKSQNKN